MAKRYLVSVGIKRANYEKTTAAKFKAKLHFVSNSYGIIYDWKIVFTAVDLDIFATGTWFDTKPKTFLRREKLFSLLKISQKKRPYKKKISEIVSLNDEQLNIFNEWVNNFYDSTLKNLVGIIKGNNPGGEAKKPSSAEMILDEEGMPKNFVILFDDLVMKKKVPMNIVAIGAEAMSFDEFVKLQPDLNSAYEYMQNAKEYSGWSIYLRNIKEYYKQYNVDRSSADSIVAKARGKYSKNIDMNIKNLPFNFKTNKEFIKCHIYEVHDLKEKIVEMIRENKSYKKYEEMISDHNNFIPLPGEIHRQFDRYLFTYKTDGNIHIINEEGNDFIKTIDEKFKQIPESFMTKERKQYFEKRNQNINW